MIDRPTLAPALATLCMGLALLTSQAGAQETPKPAAAASGVLSLCDIESRLTAAGIEIRELELRDHVVEVEGRDAQGRKVDVLVDRRSGEILSQKLDR